MITIYELMHFSGFFMKKNLHELNYQSFHLKAQSREASVIITELFTSRLPTYKVNFQTFFIHVTTLPSINNFI